MFETLVTSLIQKMSSNALILAFTGVTLATSGVAGAKLYNNLQAQQTPENVELSTEAEVLGVSTIDTIPDTKVNTADNPKLPRRSPMLNCPQS